MLRTFSEHQTHFLCVSSPNGMVGEAFVPTAEEISRSTWMDCILGLKLLQPLLYPQYLIKSAKFPAMIQYQIKLNHFLGRSS